MVYREKNSEITGNQKIMERWLTETKKGEARRRERWRSKEEVDGRYVETRLVGWGRDLRCTKTG